MIFNVFMFIAIICIILLLTDIRWRLKKIMNHFNIKEVEKAEPVSDTEIEKELEELNK